MEESPAERDVKLDDAKPLKRKSPPEPEPEPESPKRTRTNREDARTRDASPDDAPRTSPARRTELPKMSLEEARARVSQEEKRRGMRLFGGLLGTLSQRPTNPHQQKRLEIEKRQQERLKQQREVEQRALEEKKAKLEETRMRESIKWEERVLHVRHSTLLSKAKFLRTNARPHIFYKPWIVTADQKSRIQRQRHDAEDTIERELEEFRARKEEHARTYGLEAPAPERRASLEQGEAEQKPEPAKESQQQVHAVEEREESRPAPDRDHHDESNDVVVESGEDMVIY